MVDKTKVYWCSVCDVPAIFCDACEGTSCNAMSCPECKDVFNEWNDNWKIWPKKKDTIHKKEDLRKFFMRKRVAEFVEKTLIDILMKVPHEVQVEMITNRVMKCFEDVKEPENELETNTRNQTSN